MKNITEIIADLSINIACLLDEPSEVTKQDLIDLQDTITALENQHQPMDKSNLPTLAESQSDICYSDEDYDKPWVARDQSETCQFCDSDDMFVGGLCHTCAEGHYA